MVTIVNPNNPLYRQHLYRGLSTDTKPQAKNGDVFQEMDTQTLYMFDEESLAWLEIAISEKGEVVIVSGTAPVTLPDALSKEITRLVQFGNLVQNGTPTPDAPVDILCNNGALKYGVLGKNWFGLNASPVSRTYLDSTGGTGTSANWTLSDFIAVNPATQYTFNPNSTSGATAKIGYYTAEQTFISAIDSGLQTFTTPNNCFFMRFSYRNESSNIQLEVGSTATDFEPYKGKGIVADGTPEVLTVSASGAEPQTASVENLFAVGDYKDEQDIIGGTVTHKVGINVFDGTEEFITGSNGWITEAVQDQSGEIYAPVCTHFRGINTAPVRNSNTIRCYRTSGGTGRIYFAPNMTTYATADDFKAFLAAQYANGTPVIVVYPLRDETAETVTAQPLSTNEGTNTVSVTANVPVDLEVEYTKKVN